MTEPTVTQEDREAARKAWREAYDAYMDWYTAKDEVTPVRMLAQAFARHRTASAPAGEVVAYKITDADGGYWFTDKPESPDAFDCEITQVPLYAHPPAPTSKGMKDE